MIPLKIAKELGKKNCIVLDMDANPGNFTARLAFLMDEVSCVNGWGNLIAIFLHPDTINSDAWALENQARFGCLTVRKSHIVESVQEVYATESCMLPNADKYLVIGFTDQFHFVGGSC